jgi:hypothetical protein
MKYRIFDFHNKMGWLYNFTPTTIQPKIPSSVNTKKINVTSANHTYQKQSGSGHA